MPELPEVETVACALQKSLVGQSIQRTHVLSQNAFKRILPGSTSSNTHTILEKTTPKNALQGLRFEKVYRRGKWIVFCLRPTTWLVAHLRMTGKFVLLENLDCKTQSPHSHDRIWFDLVGGSRLIFQDMRRFGGVHWVDALKHFAPLTKLGIEPLSPQFTAAWLFKALQSSQMPIKVWLLNQSYVVGLGNIYVAEVLFRAQINPWLPACKVNPNQTKRLHAAIQAILQAAIQKNGTTISDFRRVDEKTGEFQAFLRVYGHANKPCGVCGMPILRQMQRQRATFYCPRCQAQRFDAAFL